MDGQRFYEIQVMGQLTERWSEWLAGLTIHYNPDGTTTLSGLLPDQAALFGVLARIHGLSLVLIAVHSAPAL
jgi:hypothetical protein